MPAFLPSTPQLILLVAMGLMIFTLWRRSSKQFRRGDEKDPPHRPSKLEDNRELALIDAPREITRWQVEMHDLARELKGELDAKMVALQIFTRQAQQASEKLERAIDRARQLGLSEVPDALTAIEQWDATTQVAPPSNAPAPPQSAEVFALADQGLAPLAIAAQTGLPIGEVELALSLRTSPFAGSTSERR